jgi:dsDNA-specific endonuclease/ATPase MutS2
MNAKSSNDDQSPVPVPIDGVLDLHTFRPSEVGDLVANYLDECREAGILEVRIIHGKGIGNRQRSVHGILSKRADVARFSFASATHGGIGATIVHLRRK